MIKKPRIAEELCVLLVLQISRIDHSDAGENALRLYRGYAAVEDSIKFSTLPVVKASSTQAAGTRGRDWLLATRTLLRHTAFLFSPRLPWINYARYLHTKRCRKIKNTNSARRGRVGTLRSAPRVPLIPRLFVPLFFSPRTFPVREIRPYTKPPLSPKR